MEWVDIATDQIGFPNGDHGVPAVLLLPMPLVGFRGALRVGDRNQIHRTRVREVRIQFPPAVSQQTFGSSQDGTIALILAIASWKVPSAFGLAGLSKPTWLSLICRKVSPPACVSAAAASPSRPSECGTPPLTVHSTPVPAQAMQFNRPRRLTHISVRRLTAGGRESLVERRGK